MKKSIHIVFCLMLLMVSCRTHKEAATHTGVLQDAPLHFERCLKNELPYEVLQSKLNLEVSLQDKTFSSRATLKIVNGQFIQLSIHPIMGIEMFRLVLSPGNLLLIDRMNKRYVSESIGIVEERLKIQFDFNLLQSLFTDRLFYPYQKRPVEADAFNDAPTDTGIAYTPKIKADYSCEFILDNAAHLTRTTLTNNAQNTSLQWNYSEFVEVEKMFFPAQMDVRVSSLTQKVALKIKGSDFQTDVSADIDTTVSPRYEKISLDQLYNALLKLL